MDTLLPGIAAERMPTSRLTVNVLEMAGRNTGHTRERTAVLFVHGNVSSLLFWQPMMLALPETFRPLAIDLRGFGDTDDEPVIATRGLRDFSDDLAAAIEALGLETVHLVGWSMGGGVVLQYLVDRPGTHRVASLTLVGLHRVGRCRASSAGCAVRGRASRCRRRGWRCGDAGGLQPAGRCQGARRAPAGRPGRAVPQHQRPGPGAHGMLATR